MANTFWTPEVSSRTRSAELPTQAVVLDVVVNEEHIDYGRTGFNVGTVRFKYLDRGGHRDSVKTAFYAYPMEVDVQSYPLIGEIVLVQKIKGNHFYSRRMNVNKRLQLNSFPNILDRVKPTKTKQDNSRAIQQARGGQLVQSSNDPAENLTNENYQRRDALFNLKHFDGDVIIQNRYGATLRFGSSQSELALNQKTEPPESEDGSNVILGPTVPLNNDPIIIMRVGERELPNLTRSTGYGLIVEDINRDDSSFVLASNQQINFHFATTDSDVHFRSSKRFTTKFPIIADITGEPDGLTKSSLMGNQSLLNSGRLVLNAKTDNIILSSGQDFISLTNKDTIFDTGEDFVVGAKQVYFLKNATSSVNKVDWSAAGYKENYDSAALAGEIIRVFKELLTELLKPGAFITAQGIPCKASGLKIAVPNVDSNPFDINKIKSYLVRIEK